MPTGAVSFSLHTDLLSIEREWRHLERHGDCTPFQTFEWLSAWQRHIGARERVQPATIAGRRAAEVLFGLPTAVVRGTFTRRLTFLGQELCDYNAPLLARGFA